MNPGESRSLRSLKIARIAPKMSRVTSRMFLQVFYIILRSHGRALYGTTVHFMHYWSYCSPYRMTSSDLDRSSDPHGGAMGCTGVRLRGWGGTSSCTGSAYPGWCWSSHPHGGATIRTGVRSRDFVALLIALGVQRRAEPCCRIRTGVPPVARGCHQLHGGATPS